MHVIQQLTKENVVQDISWKQQKMETTGQNKIIWKAPPYQASEFFFDSLWVNTHDISIGHSSHNLCYLQPKNFSKSAVSEISTV